MDKDLQRLKRLIVFSWLLLLVVIIGITFWFSAQQRHTNALLATSQASLVKPMDGKDGMPGLQGEKGQDGLDGKDSLSVHSFTSTIVEKPSTTVVQQNIPVPGEKGDKGDQGKPGEPARELEIATQTGKLVWRYVGDEAWQIVEEVLP